MGKHPVLLITMMVISTGHALAQPTESSRHGGTLQFRGAIVESSCDTAVQQSRVTTSCYRQGKNQVTTSAIVANRAVPETIGHSDFRWLDSSHKLGVLTVSYH